MFVPVAITSVWSRVFFHIPKSMKLPVPNCNYKIVLKTLCFSYYSSGFAILSVTHQNPWKIRLPVPNCNYKNVLISLSLSHYSSGFAIETEQDIMIQDNKELPRKIQCGTEKGKQKAKNHRTAGKQEIMTVMQKKPFPVFP